MNNWISICEQLPPTDRRVWFCCEIDGDFTEAELGQFNGNWTGNKNAVAMELDGADWSPCSYWMDLPKPPPTLAQRIARAIERDLNDSRGFHLDSLGDHERNKIVEKWEKLIEAELAKTS